MSRRDLQEKYGDKGGLHATMNRAIAEECAGGRLILMRIEDVYRIRRRRHSNDPDDPWATIAHWLLAIRNDMEDYIRAKYMMSPRYEDR